MPRHPWIGGSQYPDVWTALYRLYDANNRLLYVGIGHDPDARLKAHAKKDWWRDVVRIEIVWYNNRLSAAWNETKAILRENPVHNVRPGLSLVSLFVFRAPYWKRERNPARPEMLTSRYGHADALRAVRDGGAHVAVAVEDQFVGVIVPPRWYERACAVVPPPGHRYIEVESADDAARRLPEILSI